MMDLCPRLMRFKFAQRAQGTLLVAINKMDAKGADEDKVKNQMQERSDRFRGLGGRDRNCANLGSQGR